MKRSVMMVPKMILLLKKGLLAVATVTAVAMAMIGHPAHARDYIIRDHLVIDLRFGVEWLRCSVGQVWDGEACHGDIRELNHDEIKQAIADLKDQVAGVRSGEKLNEAMGTLRKTVEEEKVALRKQLAEMEGRLSDAKSKLSGLTEANTKIDSGAPPQLSLIHI